MRKYTWKRATLDHLKSWLSESRSYFCPRNPNVFSIKQLSEARLRHIMADTQSRSKSPKRNLDKTLRELRDLNILKQRPDLGTRVFEYIPNNHNEELVYKDTRSMGHIRITKCLNRLGIKYEEEKTFKDLKHHSFLRLDIYFTYLNRKIAIEYDGIQHQKPVVGWSGFSQGRQRDRIKDEYCSQNNITLVRITHDIKDIEHEITRLIQRLIFEHLTRCVLLVLIHLYRTKSC